MESCAISKLNPWFLRQMFNSKFNLKHRLWKAFFSCQHCLYSEVCFLFMHSWIKPLQQIGRGSRKCVTRNVSVVWWQHGSQDLNFPLRQHQHSPYFIQNCCSWPKMVRLIVLTWNLWQIDNNWRSIGFCGIYSILHVLSTIDSWIIFICFLFKQQNMCFHSSHIKTSNHAYLRFPSTNKSAWS